MNSCTSVIILKKISKSEIRAFESYFKRLYFNKKVVWELFMLLKKYYPLFDSPKLEKSKVALRLYNGDEKKLTEAIFKLTELLKEFLVWHEIKKDTIERDFLEFQILKKRGIHIFNQPDVKRVEAKIDEARGLQKLEHQMKWSFLQMENTNSLYTLETSKIIQNLMYDTDNFYFSLKARLFCAALNRSRALKHKFIYPLKEITAEALSKDRNLKKAQFAQVFYTIFELTEHPNEEGYDKLFAYFKKNCTFFEEKEQQEIFALLQNLLGLFPFVYQKKGSQKLFALYQFGLKSKIVIRNEAISPPIFNSIVNNCCRLKKISWMEKFIFGYKNYLKENVRDEIFTFGKIRLYFEKKKFTEVLWLIDNSNFKRFDTKLGMYAFKIKCNFEIISIVDLKNVNIRTIEPLQKAINAMNRYLRDNKEILKRRDYMSNFNFLYMFNFVISKRYNRIDFNQKMKTIGICSYSEWLQEKMELINSGT